MCVLPPAEVLDRYLLGTATSDEREMVLDALSRSRSLRRHVLEVAQQLDSLGDTDAQARFDHARVPPRRIAGFLRERVDRAIKRMTWVLHQSMFAYSLAAVLVVVAIVVLTLHRPEDTVVAVLTLPGHTVRSGIAETITTISLPPKASTLILQVPIGEPVTGDDHGSYVVTVDNASGGIIARQTVKGPLQKDHVPIRLPVTAVRNAATLVVKVTYSQP